MEDTELAQRRERGRMAQRAFRQRQITTIRELKGKNQELAGAIENVTLAAARFGRIDNPSNHDRASLETAIKEARSLAGLQHLGHDDDEDDVIQVERNHWPSPRNPANPLISTANESVVPSSESSPPPMAVSTESMLYHDVENTRVENKTINQSLIARQYNSNTDSYFHSQETSHPATTNSTRGRVSPRLTYGLWFEPDRFIRIINPPSDIVPYLGPNINTLAGAIYWAGLGYGFTVLKEVLRMRAQSTAVASSLLQDSSLASDPLPIVTRLFGHSIKAAGPDADGEQILHDIIHARFTWRRQGYIPGDHPGADPDIPNKLFSKVVEEFHTIPFSTPTSRISHQQHHGKDKSTRTSRRNSPKTATTRDVQDLSEQTTSDRTNRPISTANPERCSEAFNMDKEDLSNWLTPDEIESYVRNRLNAPIPTTSPETSTFGGPHPPSSNSSHAGKTDYSTFEAAFQSRNSSSNNNSSARQSQKRDERLRASMLKRLVRSISDKGVCFGNSPRWRIDVVSAVVDEWMAEVEAAEQAQTAAMGLYGLGFGTEHQNTDSISNSMNAGMIPAGFGPGNDDATGSSAGTTSGPSQSWYLLSTSTAAGGRYQAHEYGHGLNQSHISNPLGGTPATTTMITAPGLATTTIPFTTAGYASGGSSSSSMYYGSESEGIGAGIPEGMVF